MTPLSGAGWSEGAVAACALLARDAVKRPSLWPRACAALEAALSEAPQVVAPTLAFDLTALLGGEKLQPLAQPAPPSVRDALRAWEDHVLARLAAEPRFVRVAEAVESAPRDLRAVAVGLTAVSLGQRLAPGDALSLGPAVARRLSGRPLAEVLAEGALALEGEAVAQQVAHGLDALARGARRRRALLTDADVFLAENVGALKGLAARVALQQLADVAQAVEEALPRRLKGHVSEDGEALSNEEADAAYPMGGFSALVTQGSLENLVTSELMYMEQHGAERPDLFDVRFVEGGLLYYARDESMAVRRRRVLSVVFDASLTRARVQDPGERYQRLVWALGAVAALVRKLSAWMDAEALRFELVFVRGRDESALAEEQGVMSLLLREYRERGQLEVTEAASAEEALAQARQRRGTRARTVLVSSGATVAMEGPGRPDVLLDVGAPRPRLFQVDAPPVEGSAGTALDDAWAQVARAVLGRLLNRSVTPAAPR